MLTLSQLRTIMPALSSARATTFLPFLGAAMTEFEIGTPARQAAFLAQLAHESGQLRFMEELWGPTSAQMRYEPVTTLASRLGNTEPGDGRRFKGRGPIQITGRDNYRRYGGLLGLDLIADPPLAAKPDVAFRIAGLYWSRNGLNGLADEVSADAFKRMTRVINGGFNGLVDRERFYAVARRVLDVQPPAAPRARGTRAPGRDVEPLGRGAEVITAYLRRARLAPEAATADARPRRAMKKR